MPRKKPPITLAEHLSSIAPKGGAARMDKLTPAQRKELARSGGKVGGKARAEALTPAKRKAIARKAAQARWANRTSKQ